MRQTFTWRWSSMRVETSSPSSSGWETGWRRRLFASTLQRSLPPPFLSCWTVLWIHPYPAFQVNPNSGFWWPKIEEKNTVEKFILSFCDQKYSTIYWYLGLHGIKDVQTTREAFNLKREQPALQNFSVLWSFLPSWIRIWIHNTGAEDKCAHGQSFVSTLVSVVIRIQYCTSVVLIRREISMRIRNTFPVSTRKSQNCVVILIGSLTRDFRLQVFFINQCPPGLWVSQRDHFEFFSKIRGDIRK